MFTKGPNVSVLCSYCKGVGCARCEEFNGQYVSRFYYNMVSEMKSPATIHGYTGELKRFADYLKLNNIGELETFYKNGDKDSDIVFLTETIKKYVKRELQQKRNIGASGQTQALNAILSLYKMNQVRLDSEFIRASIKERDSEDDIEPYTHDEIKRIFDHSNLRFKALFALFCSTAMRIGGVYEYYANSYKQIGRYKYSNNYLKVKDFEPALKEIEDDTAHPERLESFNELCPDYSPTFKITVYAHSPKKQRYETYCSPEAYSLIKQYWQSRIDAGEPTGPDGNLPPDAPAFRDGFDRHPEHFMTRTRDRDRKIKRIQTPKPLATNAMEEYMSDRRKDLNIRPQTTPYHSFRRFYETEMQDPRPDTMNENYMRLLMGQKPHGMGEHYNKPPPEKLLPHYFRYVQRVTIDRLPQVEKERDELKKNTVDRITKIEQKDEKRDAVLYKILDYLTKQDQQKYIPIEPEKPALPFDLKALSKDDRKALKAALDEADKE